MILSIIRQAAKEYNLFSEHSSVLVGLSGGADSVCLTHALATLSDELGITVYTAHLNHGIRGSEAQRDEEFALSFSQKHGLRCFTQHSDIPAIAKASGVSEELAGRKARYEFFEAVCSKYEIYYIATAHNKNDNAETVLMNFMRGASTSGLRGIPAMRGRIIRPLLGADRKEIEEYCRINKLDYVTDSTNLSDNYTRNKIRHLLLPMIEQNFNIAFTDIVAANARLINDDNDYIDKQSDKIYNAAFKNNGIDVKILKEVHVSLARRIILKAIANILGGTSDVPSKYVAEVLALAEKNSGSEIRLMSGVTARNEYGRIIIEKETITDSFTCEISVGESVYIHQIDKRVKVSRATSRNNDGAVYISADTDKITVRSAKAGDSFNPLGMQGTKKLNRLFIDQKVPRHERSRIPVIEVNNTIAAVGNRIDRGFRFADRGIRIEFEDI